MLKKVLLYTVLFSSLLSANAFAAVDDETGIEHIIIFNKWIFGDVDGRWILYVRIWSGYI